MIDITATHYRVEFEPSHHKANKPGQHWVLACVEPYKADAIAQAKRFRRSRVVEVTETAVWLSSEAQVLTA